MKAGFYSNNFKIENLKIKNAGLHQINNVKSVLAAINIINSEFDMDSESIIQIKRIIDKNNNDINKIMIEKINPIKTANRFI